MVDTREPPNGDFVAFVEKIEREQLARAMQPHKLPHLSATGVVVTDGTAGEEPRALSAHEAQRVLAEEGADYEIFQRDDGSWLIDAQIPFYEFIQALEIKYLDKSKVKFNTLGGFALHNLRHIPHTAEKFKWRNFELPKL